MSNPTVTERVVDKILAIDYASLPQAAIDASKHIVLDGLACALAGATEPLGIGRIATAYIREMGGTPQASVINGGFKTSMPNAAYVNGTLTNALDFDNSLYPPTHPTSPTLPVALAIGENYRLAGKDVITAIVAAMEIQPRLRIASTGMSVGKGFHKPGILGSFGAVTAATKMLSLNREQALMAFGLVGSRAAGLAVNTGTMTKPSHAGNAARMGVESAVLAKMGWTASADVFGPKGYFDTFMQGISEPDLLTKNFADPLWVVDPGVGYKAFPCNYFTHRPIDGALELREEFKITGDQIDRVQVIFPPFDYVSRPQPRSGLDGKFSVQYTTLVALLDGEIGVDTFTNERLFAPDIKALLPKVEFTIDESIPFDKLKMHVIVNVWLKDGRKLSKRVDKLIGWPGSYGKPLTREQRHKKFFACARRMLDEKAALRTLELVEKLEQLPDILEIMDIVRAGRGA